MKSEPETDRNGTPASPATTAGDQRLSRAGRTHQQHALGYAGPDLAEAVGFLEEVDHLGDLLLHPLVSRHVGERGRGPLGRIGLGLGSADRHDPTHLALGPALEVHEDADEQQDREHQLEHRSQQGRGRIDELELGLGPERVENALVDVGGAGGDECALAVGVGALDGQRRRCSS